MGAFLDKPKTEKTSICGEGNGIRYGMSSMQGWRVSMEDAHIAEVVMSNEEPYKDWSFFAVFDGHAGPQIAERASTRILEHLMRTEQFIEMTKVLKANNGVLTEECLGLVEEGIKKGFLDFDDENKLNEQVNRSGSTAVCAIVTPSHIVIGNLGDSRAVISRNNDDIFGTQDHKPSLDMERKRIERAGGSVMIQRINGSLAVSRAFGDYDYKEHPFLSPNEQLVSPEPDTYVIKRDDSIDEFLLLACDGVYDVMENEELSVFVRSRLEVHSDLRQVCDDILDECLAKGSRDNMTSVVICLPSAPGLNPNKKKEEDQWISEIKSALDGVIEEYLSAEDYTPEDILPVSTIAEKIRNNLTSPKPIGVPSLIIFSVIEQVLTERQIKHS